ncbi:50S ribosomal protein L3 [Candidatus Woesearchaeota archaeon CG08_land_8_20_14_0_20_47_9]|nr:MAG: 50S ribosomal protein L3 [Candidatus Woesearchaeota archaeon CG1_02_47_18]PIO04171.1 MAG: 50S ribosomal protein L3 [Candidatus Woesearchaeota archaeon CG08_land_8_20_14_0_20_47_9]HII29773.1 50S ribosomal protein L3 [Candidatus Woesearchaeota archaeon]
MATIRNPRHGSMQYWPRKRAKRTCPRVRSYAKVDRPLPLGFSGYKVGMTHITITDNRAESVTSGEVISIPVSIIECPPLRVVSVRFYKESEGGSNAACEVMVPDAQLKRRLCLPKKKTDHAKRLEELGANTAEYSDIRFMVCSQPKLTGIGKKKPELFEIAIGGDDIKAKLEYAKSILGKDINISEVFSEGQLVDVSGITKGKGFQGPVKRFGIGIRQHKSEKTKRGPGNVGPWSGNRSWTVAHAGQMGFHNRLERNRWIIRIGNKPEEINVRGGFKHYGLVKNPYMLVKGSVQGPAKRLLRLNLAARPNRKRKVPEEAPTIGYVSLSSKQGR